MSTEFIRGATIPGYGTTLFVGIGIPIPILNEGIARKTAIQNKDIMTNIVDYSVPRLNRPVIKEASYEELISGSVEIDGKQIRASPLSSFKVSFNIMDKLKELIESGEFFLSGMVKPLSGETELKPMKLKERIPFVDEIMTKEVITAHPDDSITCIAELLVNGEIDQIPIVDTEDNEKLVGIVSSWDITKALARHKEKLRDIMTKNVITSRLDEPIDVVSIRFDKHGINSTPVIDEENRVIGIITTTDISKVLRRGVSK
ncbi:MAG: CBS domain-containing protein, partial [Thermodesulfovibrionia bacterium]|nr:CBS domain-containing protein [Thermodesulfovibrionia bacterium]